jgi:hypothetical protein
MKSPMSLIATAAFAVLGLPAGAQTSAPPAPTPPAAAQPAAVPPSAVPAPQPAARWTPAQMRQAFEQADSDTNGELSRAEAQRLTILPRSFEEMDQNKDGVLGRAEYESGFLR